jgi:hypothetical protein
MICALATHIVVIKTIVTNGICEKCIQISARIPGGKRLLARPRRRWEYDIETVFEGADWIGLAEGRIQWRVLVK